MPTRARQALNVLQHAAGSRRSGHGARRGHVLLGFMSRLSRPSRDAAPALCARPWLAESPRKRGVLPAPEGRYDMSGRRWLSASVGELGVWRRGVVREGGRAPRVCGRVSYSCGLACILQPWVALPSAAGSWLEPCFADLLLLSEAPASCFFVSGCDLGTSTVPYLFLFPYSGLDLSRSLLGQRSRCRSFASLRLRLRTLSRRRRHRRLLHLLRLRLWGGRIVRGRKQIGALSHSPVRMG